MWYLVVMWYVMMVVTVAGVLGADGVHIGNESLVHLEVRSRELVCLRLLEHVLQPSLYEDVRAAAADWVLRDNLDKFVRADAVTKFIEVYRAGALPRGEVFAHNNDLQMREAILVFRLLYDAIDFDAFVRTACYLRERINSGVFVYAFTVAIYHRRDCRGIYVPAPYEVLPHFFVSSRVIHRAMIMKMTKALDDPDLIKTYGVRVIGNNAVVIDWREDNRHVLSEEDRLSYFTEDIDLNALMYQDHVNYPSWFGEDVDKYNAQRWGESKMYGFQQYLARLRLERLSHNLCDVTAVDWSEVLRAGHSPNIQLPTGDEMPARSSDVTILNEHNVRQKKLVDDVEYIIHRAIFTGHLNLRDEKIIDLKKPEDVESLSRLLLGGLRLGGEDEKLTNLMKMFTKLLTYNSYKLDKITYIPTALDTYMTCLRDPVFWRLLKRLTENVVLFKNLLPKYTRNELDFPGVRINSVVVDQLISFLDDYRLDITNALYLDETEIRNKKSDMVYVAEMRRLNHRPFQITINVDSDKAVDAVVRVFIGPKYDCMGRLLGVNDKRLDMFEIDNFLYKLETGRNVIVRDSRDLHNVVGDRLWTRQLVDDSSDVLSADQLVGDIWRKSRLAFPQRLLLPLGRQDGLPLQLYVIVSPVRSGQVLPTIDLNSMKENFCGWSACIDTTPLGFPFDREIDVTRFYTDNMKFVDVKISTIDTTRKV